MAADVSIILTAHREGLLAAPSIRSARRAGTIATRNGIVVETTYVLDQADQATLEQFHFGAPADARIIEVSFGDLGLARNAGVAASSGRWVAVLDADDLWAENWIRDAFRCAEAYGGTAVWHPEINILFGLENSYFLHPDMEDEHCDLGGLAVQNYWTALCFSPRKVLIETPYRRMAVADGIGFEDWSWNLETISRGVLHKIVPGAVHAIRIKKHGVNQAAYMADCLPHPSSLLRNILLARSQAPRKLAS